MTMSATQPVIPARRWRLHLTLRVMMLLVFVFALPLGWWVNKARRQAETVKAVLRAGGTIAYDYENREFGRSKRVTQPPRWRWLISRLGVDMFHRVHRVAFERCAPVDVRIFDDLPDLRGIQIENTRLLIPDGASSKPIASLRWLKQLSLIQSGITDSDVLQLASLTDLESLTIGEDSVTDAGLRVLTSLTRLKWVILGCENATDRSLWNLDGHGRLKSLSVYETRVHDAAIKALGACGSLESLMFLDASELTNSGLIGLSEFMNLRSLHLGQLSPNEAGMVALGALVGLRNLELIWSSPIEDAGLVKLTKLTRFSFDGSQVTDMGVYPLAKLKSLDYLDLGRDTQITDLGERWLREALPRTRIVMHSKPFSVLRALNH